MPKLFCVSDIHGFYDEMIEALEKSGFDKDNPEHYCITLGDHFDRGPQPYHVMRYLMNLERWIGIFGNHESLFNECVERGYPCSHDYSNGTFDCICELGGAAEGRSFDECCVIAEQKVKRFFDRMINYFETENYIFVHSFVPLKCNDKHPVYHTRNRKFAKDPDWRHAHESAWETARWGNPFLLADKGLLPDKKLVFGHFHTSFARHYFDGEPEFGDDANFDIYDGGKFIGIDGCTAHTGKVNVLVLEDNFI